MFWHAAFRAHKAAGSHADSCYCGYVTKSVSTIVDRFTAVVRESPCWETHDFLAKPARKPAF